MSVEGLHNLTVYEYLRYFTGILQDYLTRVMLSLIKKNRNVGEKNVSVTPPVLKLYE